jgi:hypothetical protein
MTEATPSVSRELCEAFVRALTFSCDLMPLKDIVPQIISRADEKRDRDLPVTNHCFRYGLLKVLQVAHGTTKWLEASDWGPPPKRTIHAVEINPAEGVWVEPREDRVKYFVQRPDPATLTTTPVTPATPADRQLYAEGKLEPAARAEESMPEPARRGHPKEYDWDEGLQFMRRELDERGDPKNPINAVEGWRSDADVARLVAAHVALPDGRQPDPKHTARVIRPELQKWRAEQSRN